MGAMNEEIDSLTAELRGASVSQTGSREYHTGQLWGRDVVLAFSRWGKVAAATTATSLIVKHEVSAILFTGVAGGIDPSLRVGDVIVGSRFYHHDMDARPIFERHEIPLLGTRALLADEQLQAGLLAASERFLGRVEEHIAPETLRSFGIDRPRVAPGEIASGDRFFASKADAAELRERLPLVRCVEMEGAAVAQVCHEHGVPFAVLRTISDAADDSAPVDFLRFLRAVASAYSHGILREYLEGRSTTAPAAAASSPVS
jgi:adenosylhomocysteine nucleosidase